MYIESHQEMWGGQFAFDFSPVGSLPHLWYVLIWAYRREDMVRRESIVLSGICRGVLVYILEDVVFWYAFQTLG